MLRRDPGAVLTAHRMDPRRRELYVEGIGDKAFLEWLAGDRLARDSRVILIEHIETPGVEQGGNRARLLDFLRLVQGEAADIRGLVDADLDRMLPDSADTPANAWLTDHRDLESYVLNEANIDAVLRAGCGLLAPKADQVYASMAKSARVLAAARLVSARQSLCLPVSRGTWIKYVTCKNGLSTDVNRQSLATALLQRADLSLANLPQLLTDIEAAESELAELSDLETLHGKDCMKILTKQLSTVGVNLGDAGHLVRATFSRGTLHQFPTLAAVVEYLAGS